MKTSFWGPSAWRFLHAITFAYPEDPSDEDKRAALDLFSSLERLLPCEACCKHYSSGCKRFPVIGHVDSRENLSKWLVDLHNRVNKGLHKSQMSYEDAAKEYLSPSSTLCSTAPLVDRMSKESRRSHNNESRRSSKLIIIVIVIVIGLVLVAFNIKRWTT